MKITIVPVDGVVVVDGDARFGIDMTGIDPDVHAVQFDSVKGRGHVEFSDDMPGGKRHNQPLSDISTYQVFVDRWTAAEPPPPPPPPPPTDIVDQIAALSPARRAALKAELAR